jgi:membrane protein YdbS with pleckstrin-like domain
MALRGPDQRDLRKAGVITTDIEIKKGEKYAVIFLMVVFCALVFVTAYYSVKYLIEEPIWRILFGIVVALFVIIILVIIDPLKEYREKQEKPSLFDECQSCIHEDEMTICETCKKPDEHQPTNYEEG